MILYFKKFEGIEMRKICLIICVSFLSFAGLAKANLQIKIINKSNYSITDFTLHGYTTFKENDDNDMFGCRSFHDQTLKPMEQKTFFVVNSDSKKDKEMPLCSFYFPAIYSIHLLINTVDDSDEQVPWIKTGATSPGHVLYEKNLQQGEAIITIHNKSIDFEFTPRIQNNILVNGYIRTTANKMIPSKASNIICNHLWCPK